MLCSRRASMLCSRRAILSAHYPIGSIQTPYSNTCDGNPEELEPQLSLWDGYPNNAARNEYLGHFNEAFQQNSDFLDTVNINNTFNADSYTEAYIPNTQCPPVGQTSSEPSRIFANPPSGILQTPSVAYGSSSQSLDLGACSGRLPEPSAPIEKVGMPGSFRYRPNHVYGTAGSSGELRKIEYVRTQTYHMLSSLTI